MMAGIMCIRAKVVERGEKSYMGQIDQIIRRGLPSTDGTKMVTRKRDELH